MIFRAIFWVGLVALLMPHEPDLGFGRPGVDSAPLPEVAAWAKDKVGAGLNDPASVCRYNVDACAATASVLDDVRSAAIRSLVSVKADIEQNARHKLHAPGG
jgi:hypothetical protein